MVTYYNVTVGLAEGGSLVAEVAGAEVEQQLAVRLDEDRIPARVAQREPQHAVGLQARGARRQDWAEVVQVQRAAGAGDVLANARRRRIAATCRIHPIEALVQMIVAVDDDVDAERI